jgi:hypothetical protein
VHHAGLLALEPALAAAAVALPVAIRDVEQWQYEHTSAQSAAYHTGTTQ